MGKGKWQEEKEMKRDEEDLKSELVDWVEEYKAKVAKDVITDQGEVIYKGGKAKSIG